MTSEVPRPAAAVCKTCAVPPFLLFVGPSRHTLRCASVYERGLLADAAFWFDCQWDSAFVHALQALECAASMSLDGLKEACAGF